MANSIPYNVLTAVWHSRKIHSNLLKSGVSDILEDVHKHIFMIFSSWYKENPDIDKIDLPTFKAYFELRYKELDPEKKEQYLTIFKKINNREFNMDTMNVLMERVVEDKYANKMADIIFNYQEGEEVDLMSEVNNLVKEFKNVSTAFNKTLWVQDDISDILEKQEKEGIKWRLNCLQEHMQPIPPGTFGIVAARPDKGKTTFLASEAVYFAKQLPKDKNVIWLNNEGTGSKIIPRLYQAALDITKTQLKEKVDKNIAVKEFIEYIGRIDKIRVVDIHNKTAGQVERILDDMNPGLVIFDMIDNIKFPSLTASKTDALEAMYQWARDYMVEINSVGIATSQISEAGKNEMYPDYTYLKDSRTGKQGACDFIVLIGHYSDPGLDHKRGISIPKNKLRVEGKPKDCRTEVLFKPEIARFLDEPLEGE